MTSVLSGPSVRHPKTEQFSWRMAAAVVLLLTLGALTSLLAGSGSPVVIGPDGMAGTWVGAP
jgi:hypothetical protein